MKPRVIDIYAFVDNEMTVRLCLCAVRMGKSGKIAICIPKRKINIEKWKDERVRARNKLQATMSPEMARQLAEKLRMLAESIEG